MALNPHWVSFNISSSFKTKVRLPDQNGWRFHRDDAVLSDTIYSAIQRKGRLFKHNLPRKHRPMTVTIDGFLVIYEEESEGYVLLLKNVTDVTTRVHMSDGFESRSSIKIKFSFGTVQLLLLGHSYVAWLDALSCKGIPVRKVNNYADSTSSLAVNRSLTPKELEAMEEDYEVEEQKEEEGHIGPEEEKEDEEEVLPMEKIHTVSLIIPMTTFHEMKDVEVTADDVKKSASFYDPTDNDDLESLAESVISVRNGDLSVATLRGILEEKLTGTLKRKAAKVRPLAPTVFSEKVALARQAFIQGQNSDSSDSL